MCVCFARFESNSRCYSRLNNSSVLCGRSDSGNLSRIRRKNMMLGNCRMNNMFTPANLIFYFPKLLQDHVADRVARKWKRQTKNLNGNGSCCREKSGDYSFLACGPRFRYVGSPIVLSKRGALFTFLNDDALVLFRSALSWSKQAHLGCTRCGPALRSWVILVVESITRRERAKMCYFESALQRSVPFKFFARKQSLPNVPST